MNEVNSKQRLIKLSCNIDDHKYAFYSMRVACLFKLEKKYNDILKICGKVFFRYISDNDIVLTKIIPFLLDNIWNDIYNKYQNHEQIPINDRLIKFPKNFYNNYFGKYSMKDRNLEWYLNDFKPNEICAYLCGNQNYCTFLRNFNCNQRGMIIPDIKEISLAALNGNLDYFVDLTNMIKGFHSHPRNKLSYEEVFLKFYNLNPYLRAPPTIFDIFGQNKYIIKGLLKIYKLYNFNYTGIDNRGEPISHLVTRYTNNNELIKLVIDEAKLQNFNIHRFIDCQWDGPENQQKNTPMRFIILNKNLEAFKMMIENMTIEQFLFVKPLHHAIDTNDINIVKFINENYLEFKRKNPKYKIKSDDFLRNDISPCGYACNINNIEILEYLLNFDYCNFIGLNKLTLPHRAVINNNFDILKLLSEKYKLDLNLMDKKKCTPFYYSLYNFNVEIIKYLHKKCSNNIDSIIEKYGSFAYIITNNSRYIEFKTLPKIIDCLIWIFQNYRNHLIKECNTGPNSLLKKRTPIQNLHKYTKNKITNEIEEVRYNNPVIKNLITVLGLLINTPINEDLSLESIDIISKIKGSQIDYKRKYVEPFDNKQNKKYKNKK